MKGKLQDQMGSLTKNKRHFQHCFDAECFMFSMYLETVWSTVADAQSQR